MAGKKVTTQTIKVNPTHIVTRQSTDILAVEDREVAEVRVRNIPLWLKHAPGDADGMTLPDIVFPCFLFVVGMAIPYAIGARIKRGESLFRIWRHILVRIFSLLVLGVFMVNAEGGYN